MKTISNIILCIFGIAFLYLVLFIPLESNYNINKVDEENGLMYITYSSMIPFTKVDTVTKMPTYFYGKVLYNYYEKKDGQTTYRTAVQVGKEIYTYKDINAYHYVKEFTVGKDSIKLLEIYWPSHYIQTLPFNKIYGKD